MNAAIKLVFRIFLYWVAVSLTASFITSFISCFVPFEYLQDHFEYGFHPRSLRYFRLTVLFYFAVSFFIAFPGFIMNIVVYFNKKISTSGRITSIVINSFIAIVGLLVYHYFNISKSNDFWGVIVPAYMLSIIFYGFLILPGKTLLKGNQSFK